MLALLLYESGPVLYCLLSLISVVQAILVNVTVDDSLPDPLTGNLITYLPGTAWKAGVACTDCTAAADGGQMLDRTWHDGTYFPANSNLPPTGPLNATFKFNGSAIYVFCAIALSTSSPTGYSNMTFYIDGELVGQFERVPPGVQAYDYNVSVYSNSSLTPGEHQFMLQNGQPGNAGNKSLTLFDYLIYSYDNGAPAPTSTTSTIAMSSPTTSVSSESRSSVSAGPIAGGVVGGIVGLVIVALMIWFWSRKKSGSTLSRHERSHSFNLGTPADNNTVPGPFITQSSASLLLTAHANSSRAPASNSSNYPLTPTSYPSIGYGIGTGKRARSQHRYIPTSPSSHAPSSSIEVLSSESQPAATSSTRRREVDAGPAALDDQAEDEETLPPEYGDVFANANAWASAIPGPSTAARENEKL